MYLQESYTMVTFVFIVQYKYKISIHLQVSEPAGNNAGAKEFDVYRETGNF